MQRLQVALFALLLGLVSLGCHSVAARNDLGSLYYLDGVDRQDGMSASIDLVRKTMRVAGDGFLLHSCGERDPSNQCVNSDYFLFVLNGVTNEKWTAQGVTFSAIGTCLLSSARGDLRTSIVSSDQKYGALRFYVGPNDELVGWTLNHADGTDHFLKSGLKLGSCAAK